MYIVAESRSGQNKSAHTNWNKAVESRDWYKKNGIDVFIYNSESESSSE